MKILAVDYGDSRTGLATCDRTEFLTTAITPQITLKARNKVAARVCEVAKEIEAEMILIGLPLNMDGTEGERAAKSRKLAKTVELWSGLPVRMWDERQTTCAAADLLDESGTYGSRRTYSGNNRLTYLHILSTSRLMPKYYSTLLSASTILTFISRLCINSITITAKHIVIRPENTKLIGCTVLPNITISISAVFTTKSTRNLPNTMPATVPIRVSITVSLNTYIDTSLS